MIRLHIDNSYASAVKTGKWKNPGARFYDKLLDALDWKGDNLVGVDDLTTGTMDYLKEAYLVVGKVANTPYGRTPFSRSGCKYPHHTIKNGRLVVSIPGLRAAYARAKQMGEFKGEIKKHLIRHYKEMRIFADSMMESDMQIEENFSEIESFLENTGVLMERSQGRLKTDHRLAVDINTGHELHIVYELDGIQVTKWPHFPDPEARIDIKRSGNTDHESYGQKVLAIIDLSTGEKLQEVNCRGPIWQANSKVFHVKVGEIDMEPSWKSTFWPKAGSLYDRSKLSNVGRIIAAEKQTSGRGSMFHNWDPSRSIDRYKGKPFPGKHEDTLRFTASRDPMVKAKEREIIKKLADLSEIEKKLTHWTKRTEEEEDPSQKAEWKTYADDYKEKETTCRKEIDSLCQEIGVDPEVVYQNRKGLPRLKNGSTDPFNEAVIFDSEDDHFEEKSQGKLNQCFRVCVNVENGHMIRVVFDLKQEDVVQIGDHTQQAGRNVKADIEAIRSIRRNGNTNFSSTSTVLAILDLDTKQKLQSVKTIGVIGNDGTRFTVPEKYKDQRLKDDWSTFSAYPVFVREKIASEQDHTNAPDVLTFTVGQKEQKPSYKSTRATWSTTDVYNGQWKKGKGYQPDGDRTGMHIRNAVQQLKSRADQVRAVADEDDVEAFDRWYRKIMQLIQEQENEKFGQTPGDARYSALYNRMRTLVHDMEYDAKKMESVEDLSSWIDQFTHSDVFREAVDAKNPMTIQTPEAFCEWLRTHIQYGWIPYHPLNMAKKIFMYMTEEFRYGSVGHMQSPSELSKSMTGTCWDFTSFEVDYMKRLFPDLEMKAYYAQFFHPEDAEAAEDPCHTFMTFQWENEWYYLEIAFNTIAGIYKGNETDICNYVLGNMAKMKGHNLFSEGYEYDIWEYNALDSALYGLDDKSFMEYVMGHGTCLHHEYINEGNLVKIMDMEPTVMGTGEEDDEQAFFQWYRLQSPQQLVLSGVGVCWDSVRLEEAWLKGHGYHPIVYYMEINDGENCPSHTFTVFPDDGQFYLIDRSVGWKLVPFRSMNELYYSVQFDFRRDHDDQNSPLFIKKLPTVSTGMTCEQYMKRAHEGETVYGEEDLYQESMNIVFVKVPVYMIKAEVMAMDGVNGVLYNEYDRGVLVSRILVSEDGIGFHALTRPDQRRKGYMKYLIKWCVKHTRLRKMYVPTDNKPMALLLDQVGFLPSSQTDPAITMSIDPEDLEELRENTWKVTEDWLRNHHYDPILSTIQSNGNRFCCTVEKQIPQSNPMDIMKRAFESGSMLYRLEKNGHNVYEAFQLNAPVSAYEQLLVEGGTYLPTAEGTLYFTEEGLDHFFSSVWPIMQPYLGDVELFTCSGQAGTLLESDAYHIILEDPMKIEEFRAIERRVNMGSNATPITEAATEKNGVRRQRLYEAFKDWAWKQNEKNTFSRAFDKDTFQVTYPFVPNDMRYFYRWANPMLCVVKDDMCWFQLSELRKVNSDVNLDQLMIFASSESEQLVFNKEDNGIYRAEIENEELTLKEQLGTNFDEWLQAYIGSGDILHMTDEELEKLMHKEKQSIFS